MCNLAEVIFWKKLKPLHRLAFFVCFASDTEKTLFSAKTILINLGPRRTARLNVRGPSQQGRIKSSFVHIVSVMSLPRRKDKERLHHHPLSSADCKKWPPWPKQWPFFCDTASLLVVHQESSKFCSKCVPFGGFFWSFWFTLMTLDFNKEVTSDFSGSGHVLRVLQAAVRGPRVLSKMSVSIFRGPAASVYSRNNPGWPSVWNPKNPETSWDTIQDDHTDLQTKLDKI